MIDELTEKLGSVRHQRGMLIAEGNALLAEVNRLQGRLQEINSQILVFNGAEAQLADIIKELGGDPNPKPPLQPASPAPAAPATRSSPRRRR